ncbi:MAG TPA: Nif3-like dinuclear metal center hexameric protein [Longimicrobium sp.]|jgi:putative NIF3 family GTP cyclohydrolase 1 type 2
MIALTALAASIERITGADRFADEPPIIFVPSTREVRRLGVALEPSAAVMERVRDEGLDALFLHRPWGVEAAGLPADVGVLASHLPFDERLTIGYNPDLAQALGLANIEAFRAKEGRALGMIGDFVGEFDALVRRIAAEFGEPQHVEPGSGGRVERVAVVGAMTDALVRDAAARGAGAYVTGQMRAPARAAVDETGIAVIAVGHRRAEVWGLHLLARLLSKEWPGLTTLVLDAP